MKTMQEELSEAYKTSSQLWKSYLLQLFALKEEIANIEYFLLLLSVAFVWHGQKIDYFDIALSLIIPRMGRFLYSIILIPAVTGFKNSWAKSEAERKNRA
jgi:hypothetical protein